MKDLCHRVPAWGVLEPWVSQCDLYCMYLNFWRQISAFSLILHIYCSVCMGIPVLSCTVYVQVYILYYYCVCVYIYS